MTEHALQAAFARQESAPSALIVARFYTISVHLVETCRHLDDWVEDARHEIIGARCWNGVCRRMFPDQCVCMFRETYLCATDHNYVAMLSHASLVTLKLQGGPMPRNECYNSKQTYARDAVRLRRWDDQGKVPA